MRKKGRSLSKNIFHTQHRFSSIIILLGFIGSAVTWIGNVETRLSVLEKYNSVVMDAIVRETERQNEANELQYKLLMRLENRVQDYFDSIHMHLTQKDSDLRKARSNEAKEYDHDSPVLSTDSNQDQFATDEIFGELIGFNFHI